MVVNFADKIVVGLAGVPIMTDLCLEPAQFGLLGSAFFFLFSISAILVGFLVNRVETTLGIVWPGADLGVGPIPDDVGSQFHDAAYLPHHLGAGEGSAFSVAAHAIYKWFPDEKRTLPTAIFSQGSSFGVILAVPALNWVIVNYSWHAAFGTLGVIGLIWAVLWLLIGAEGPLVGKAVEEEHGGQTYPYSRLLTAPTFIGSVLSSFGAYWVLSLGLTWFTPFIVKGLGYSQHQAGFISVLPWVLGAVVVLITGRVSQMLMARGVSTYYARGMLGSVPLIVDGLVFIVVPYFEGRELLIALLVLGSILYGSIYVVCPPMLGEFAPVGQRGAIIAIYSGLYTLAGVLSAIVMGGIIEHAATPLEGFLRGFQLNGVILIGSGLCGVLMLPPHTERSRLLRGVSAQPRAFAPPTCNDRRAPTPSSGRR